MSVPQIPPYIKRLTSGEWAALPLPERALHVARAQLDLKVRELSPNWGGMVTVYLRVSGWRSPAPWCAAFVYWCLIEAGADKKKLWPRPASTLSLAQWAKKEGRIRLVPSRGTVFVWNNGRSGHTGFVRAVADAAVGTLEGNTDDAGSREGVKVAERMRLISSFRRYRYWGFINLEGLE